VGVDRRGLDHDLRLRIVVRARVVATPTPAPPRSPAAAGPDNHHPAVPPAAAIPSALTDPAASADPRESGRGGNQPPHDTQERDDGCLLHGYTTATQRRPRAYIVSIPRDISRFRQSRPPPRKGPISRQNVKGRGSGGRPKGRPPVRGRSA